MAEFGKTSASCKRFFVILAAETNGAHKDIIEKLKAAGHCEVTSLEACDYIVVFCPVVKRTGLDIDKALNKIPADKPSILVVMHHTFNPDLVVAESRRLVTNPNVLLTVDCLFYEGHFLECKRNDEAWGEVKKILRVSNNQERSWFPNWFPWNSSDKLVEKVAGKKLAIILAGKTNGAHDDFVKKLKADGHTEVSSPEGCDYVVCFCPVALRVGTDINEVLDKIPADKPTILVVMHHTFNPDLVVAESRTLVTNPNVLLTLDCLFYENHFLECKRNDEAWDEVKKILRVSDIQVRKISSIKMPLHNTFSVLLINGIGEKNNVHHDFVDKLKDFGLTEVSCYEENYHLVIFCYVTSQDDIQWVNKIAAGKPSILVVMHHTSNPDHVVAESRRLVYNPDIHLTVDCLFKGNHFLNCSHNEAMWFEFQKYLGVPVSQNLFWSASWKRFYVALVETNIKAHRGLVKRFEGAGHTEVDFPLECDYLLVFCPVTSQGGTDIGKALNDIPDDKPILLVWMHHSTHQDPVIDKSRRLTSRLIAHLTVDCVFNDSEFLKCEHNVTAWSKIQEHLSQTGLIPENTDVSE